MNWIPLCCHSDFSLLAATSKPKQIAAKCFEFGYKACALTDRSSLAGSVDFVKAMKNVGIKPILGLEAYLSIQDATIKTKENVTSHLCVLAKNLIGWKSLIKASSDSNRQEHFYKKPRLSLDRLASYAEGNFIAFSGHPGSDMGNVIFKDFRAAYSARTYEAARALVDDDWKAKATALAGKYQELFGKGNFFLEIQLIDAQNMPATQVIAHALRIISRRTGIPCVATAAPFYINPEDAEDQRVLLCSAFETTLNGAQRKIESDEDISLGAFFRSYRYHIPKLDEMVAIHETMELANSVMVSEICEHYDILNRPVLPHFDCPDGMGPDEYLKKLCIDGWNKKISSSVQDGLVMTARGYDKYFPLTTYQERVREELGVLQGAGLSSYFLIVQDYMNWARQQGWLVGCRGSGAGCLVSYLLGISNIDPLPADLSFARFYNAGRNTADRVSLPDIDCDFPISKRALVKEYIKTKYGQERVAEMVTFSRMQGRGALKDVLRAHERCSFEEMNRMTAHIPDEAAISDKLQEMRAETGEASIIRWALENSPEQLREFCFIGEDGSLDGPYARDFAQAIRLEGTKRSQSKHAAGIVIAASSLSEICPMVYDKNTQQMVCGLEMGALEAIGICKYDCLGLVSYDKISGVKELLATGKIGNW